MPVITVQKVTGMIPIGLKSGAIVKTARPTRRRIMLEIQEARIASRPTHHKRRQVTRPEKIYLPLLYFEILFLVIVEPSVQAAYLFIQLKRERLKCQFVDIGDANET